MTFLMTLALHHPIAIAIWAARIAWYAYRFGSRIELPSRYRWITDSPATHPTNQPCKCI